MCVQYQRCVKIKEKNEILNDTHLSKFVEELHIDKGDFDVLSPVHVIRTTFK